MINVLINPLEDIIMFNDELINLNELFVRSSEITNIYVINGPGAYTAVKKYLSIVKAFHYKGFSCFSLNILDILKLFVTKDSSVLFIYKHLMWYSHNDITKIVYDMPKVNVIGITSQMNIKINNINENTKIIDCQSKELKKYLYVAKKLEQNYNDHYNL